MKKPPLIHWSVIKALKLHVLSVKYCYWPPQLSCYGHSLVVPMRVFLLSLLLFKGQPKSNTNSTHTCKVTLFWKSRWQIRVQREFTVTSGKNIQTCIYRDCLEVTLFPLRNKSDRENIQGKQTPI